ncbi:type IX secretion system membrane protein PorP/SprF [Litoribacter ruber]|uniref:Type IX secretion system membrane protein PorP/SprF n=1 Tax=Litoribacter ruber TaxID=702568 RepID=A0AAP2CGI5_9BACT|nr:MULTISPECIES: type IX secretion system membrane protein PorP/SprF [Litoribacter]MBS9524223.1 type IX secretion system membrane protein PorP/SprF [Litoribacter alkaliphilus]MBT0809979.1 type IX secretion system membrane protein PorP/SprF [Litoribacter ruber]
MKKRYYLILSVLCGSLINLWCTSAAHAQQDAQFTQYMYNGLYYNPAFAGKENGYHFSALHRTQWLGYNAPSSGGNGINTQLLTAAGRIANTNLGFGLNFVNDDIGPTANQEVNVSLGYHLQIGRGVLSLGASGGFFSSTIKYDELNPVNPDPLLPASGRESQINFNFGAGALYDHGNFYVGLSSRHLNEPEFDFGEGLFGNQLRNHSYLLAGYRIRTFGQFSFEPNLLLKTVSLDNFSYDISVIATHNDKISGGLAYRGEESVSVLFGYSLLRDNSLRLGYAFDLVIGGVEAKAPTSHEFMLAYQLPTVARDIQRVIQRTPRFRF